MKKLYSVLKFIVSHPIGRKRKIKALYRFFSWQLLSRLKKTPRIFDFIADTKLNISKGQTIATGNYYVGLLEFEEMAFLLHFLNKEDTFFDVGANIGVYSVLASGVCKAKSFAFEPIKNTLSVFKKNIELNNLTEKITAYNIGLSDKTAKLEFTTELDTKNHIVTETEHWSETNYIAVKPMDEFLNFYPSLIKIDVEGYEEFVLKGGLSIIEDQNLAAIIIEVNNEGERYNVDPDDIHKLLCSKQFKLYAYKPFKRELVPITRPVGDNRIYIRDLNRVNNKIRHSEAFDVWGIKL